MSASDSVPLRARLDLAPLLGKAAARPGPALPPPQAAARPPVVSCCLVIGDPQRLNPARQAVEAFMRQTYPFRQLVVVNATGQPLITAPQDNIREIAAPEADRRAVGRLRNLAADAADGEWLALWDDDDYHHPDRLLHQLAARREGHAGLLAYQIRFDIRRCAAFLYHDPAGIPATVLWPKTVARFPDLALCEDRAFVMTNWGHATTVLANGPGPAGLHCLSVAFYHGLNATPLAQFMAGRAGPEADHRFDLDAVARDHLLRVLDRYKFRVTMTGPAGDVKVLAGADLPVAQAAEPAAEPAPPA